MQLLTAVTALASLVVGSCFVHPGVLIDQNQLDFVRAKWAAGVEPFASAFKNAEAYYLSQRQNATGPTLANGTIACGSYSHPDYGCTAESTDLEAAVIQSYLWAVGGDVSYARSAISILNHYAKYLKAYTLSNAPLQAAWSALKYARAAEILVHTNAPWDPADVAAFKEFLYRVSLPEIYKGSCANGNWELAMIEGMVGIAVFTDNQTLFNHSLDMWRVRVPGYFYISSDGPKPHPAGSCNEFWYNQTVFNSSVDGVAQETCRDFGHLGYGIASTFNFAETARIQGVDVYSEQKDRLHAALEFHAALINQGDAHPGTNLSTPLLCSGIPLKLANPPTFQVGLTAFARYGTSLPQSQTYVQNVLWKSTAPTEMFMAIFEPLTHGGTNETSLTL